MVVAAHSRGSVVQSYFVCSSYSDPRQCPGFFIEYRRNNSVMSKVHLTTSVKRMLADVYTPVGIYLRLRDRFRDTVLLESADHHSPADSYSFIGINAIAGIEINGSGQVEYKLPGEKPEKTALSTTATADKIMWSFMQRFSVAETADPAAKYAQGLFGYTSYDAVQLFESIKLAVRTPTIDAPIPLMRYRLYQYVVAINHHKDELFLCENQFAGITGESSLVESLIRSKDVPVYPFQIEGEESTQQTDTDYLENVARGISHCKRGDVFQMVLSRRFKQAFTGDEFNVYRALRSINPSPYLFFFDYGDYKIFGSSPEAQLVIKNGQALLHPIAGTFQRTGEAAKDEVAATLLTKDPKENAEHVMLVDLARNDLSTVCENVTVSRYKEVQYFSHVIHLVSEVAGTVSADHNPFHVVARTFPAGTLSGAPKFKAMELIDKYEPVSRTYYGGAIGFMGFDGSCNHAIMIRTFLSQHNTLTYQAGAGVVAASVPANELAEVNNKLRALKKALLMAQDIF